MSDEKRPPEEAGDEGVVIYLEDKVRPGAGGWWPAPGEPYKGMPPGLWQHKADEYGLPPDCPVKPLGMGGGRRPTYYFLSPTGRVYELMSSEFSKMTIIGLFAPHEDYLKWAWPRWKKAKDAPDGMVVDTFEGEKAAAALMAAASFAGSWDPADRLRGRGAWPAPDGGLVLHCGDVVFMRGRRQAPGIIGRHLYQVGDAVGAPWPKPVPEKDSPAYTLLPLLRSWAWERPEVDPILMFGWMAAAMIGGALPVRPIAYISGDFATGKTTLQELIKHVMGDWLITSVNATEAGVSQRIHNDALPVAIDEMEPTLYSSKAKNLIELARQAYSGGIRLRGGADHKASEFMARSAFVFSSINEPPLEPQDLSRMALFRLQRLAADAPELKLDAQALAVAGRKLLRRLMDGFDVLPQLYGQWRKLLAEAGHDSRGQDTFGILLACAELAMGHLAADDLKVPFVDGVEQWAHWLKADTLAENEGRVENWRRCLDHLMGWQIDARRDGVKPTVGWVLEQTLLQPAAEAMMLEEAQRLLAQAGVRLMDVQRSVSGDWQAWLAVPNKSPELWRVFDGTPWGAGGWANALRQAPRGEVWRSEVARINGVSRRCKVIDLRQVLL